MSIPKAPIKIKLTGDTHLPDVESDLDIEEGTSSLAKLAKPRDQGGRPLVRRAGVLVAPEGDDALDATAGARDASTSRRTMPRGGDARNDAPGEDESRGTQWSRRPAGTQPQAQLRNGGFGVWLGALAVAVLLVKLLR